MSTETILIGVDPGAGGGVAWTKPGEGVVCTPMPPDFDGLARLAHYIQEKALETDGMVQIVCYVEQVSGYTKPGKSDMVREEVDGVVILKERENRQPGSAMFNFGKNVGAEIMAFVMIGAKIIEVHPAVWMKPFGLKKLGRGKTEWKNALKSTAQRKFPGIKVTLKTADALLILSYASLKERGSAVLTLGNGQTQPGAKPDSAAEAVSEFPDDRTDAEVQAARFPLRPRATEAGVSGTFGNCHDCNAPFFDKHAGIPWDFGISAEVLCCTCSDARKTAYNQSLFLCEWKKATWVFKRGERQDVIIRRATALDLRQIQPGKVR